MRLKATRPDCFDRPFVKMHGLRNHFVIVDARREPFRPDTADVVRICDVQVGVGGDQLVVIEPPVDDSATAFMRLYNVDGREVGACGNATRCVAWLLLEEAGDDRVAIETLAGVLDCRRAGELSVTCDMGRLRDDWQAIPLSADVDTDALDVPAAGVTEGVAVNVGNPHVVFFVEDHDAIDIVRTARTIQSDALFPEQVNVGFARVTGPQSMKLVVYERGAGLTTACGSGACAAAWAAARRGLVGDGPVTVALPGGVVRIEITDDGHAIMTGPVAYSFRGVL
jgi:diaminopimelate epimerase